MSGRGRVLAIGAVFLLCLPSTIVAPDPYWGAMMFPNEPLDQVSILPPKDNLHLVEPQEYLTPEQFGPYLATRASKNYPEGEYNWDYYPNQYDRYREFAMCLKNIEQKLMAVVDKHKEKCLRRWSQVKIGCVLASPPFDKYNRRAGEPLSSKRADEFDAFFSKVEECIEGSTTHKCKPPHIFFPTNTYGLMNSCMKRHAHLLPEPQTAARPGDEVPPKLLDDEEFWNKVGDRVIPGVTRPEGMGQRRKTDEETGKGGDVKAFVHQKSAKLGAWAKEARPMESVKGMIKNVPQLAKQFRQGAPPLVMPKYLPGLGGGIPKIV
ncbi:MAG: hypothetical protein M1823_004431 [Watsoniomyces obsoletus]|nr:MAG: hypothetical protein M1823_004431 [Watsoniomyces obsoletus]